MAVGLLCAFVYWRSNFSHVVVLLCLALRHFALLPQSLWFYLHVRETPTLSFCLDLNENGLNHLLIFSYAWYNTCICVM